MRKIASNAITTTSADPAVVVEYIIPFEKSFRLKYVSVGAEPTTPIAEEQVALGYIWLDINGVDYAIEACGIKSLYGAGIYGTPGATSTPRGGSPHSPEQMGAFNLGFPLFAGLPFNAGDVIKIECQPVDSTSMRWFGALIGEEEIPPSPPPITEAKTFPMFYLLKPAKAQELRSKVEGGSILKIAKDFPEILLKSGKGMELRSKWLEKVWLSGWQYRKSHVIDPATGAGTNYQKRVVAHYGSGEDSGEDVYLGGKCRTDFGDVRFTDDDGNTLLDYWIEQYVNSQSEITKAIQASWMAADGTLYAGSGNTLYKSTDKGQNWTALKTFSSATIIRSVFVSSQGYIFASPDAGADINDSGLWRSIDNGQNWTRVLALAVGCTIWGIDEDSNGKLFAGVYTTTVDNARIYRSTDNGENWFSVYYNDGARHIHDVKVDKSNNYVYATCGDNFSPYFNKDILRSVDGGDNWGVILAAMPQCVAICVVSGARLFGSDTASGLLYRTTDDSTYTTVLNAGISSDIFWIRKDASTNKTFVSFFAASVPIGARIYVSDNEGVTWTLQRTLTATEAGDGSQYGSNFVQGVMYYGVFESGAWINGSRLYIYSIICWVEVADSLESQAQTIYVYYGKADATTTSNGNNTFPFFDQFSGDLSKWTVVGGTWQIEDGELSSQTTAFGQRLRANAITITNHAVHVKIRWISGTYFEHCPIMRGQSPDDHQNGYAALLSTWTGDNRHRISKLVSGSETTLAKQGTTNPSTGVTYQFIFKLAGTTLKASAAPLYPTELSITDSSFSSGSFCMFNWDGSGEHVHYDDVFVRKYVDPEPAHAAWGNEETA